MKMIRYITIIVFMTFYITDINAQLPNKEERISINRCYQLGVPGEVDNPTLILYKAGLSNPLISESEFVEQSNALFFLLTTKFIDRDWTDCGKIYITNKAYEENPLVWEAMESTSDYSINISNSDKTINVEVLHFKHNTEIPGKEVLFNHSYSLEEFELIFEKLY